MVYTQYMLLLFVVVVVVAVVVVVVVVVEEVDGEVSKKLHWDTNHVQAVTLWLSALPLSYLNRDKEGRYYPVLELGVIPLVHLWRHEKQGTVLN